MAQLKSTNKIAVSKITVCALKIWQEKTLFPYQKTHNEVRIIAVSIFFLDRTIKEN